MTKKDFELIARVLFAAKPAIGFEKERQWTRTVNGFTEALAEHNPRFNLGKFERACKTGEGLFVDGVSVS